MSHADLVDRLLGGDRRALARYLTLIEDAETDLAADLALVSGRAPRIGFTGPPGAGKSTLVDALTTHWRGRGLSVAVLAVDPSSPLTGGAILGDRIRMQHHADDPGVFIRSMATRGHLGGLATAASPAIQAMRAAGFDVVIVETVGVGQSEVEVMDVVDLVVLVVAPGWGDQVQADKAGVVEIADVIVVNKGDQPGADEVAHALAGAVDGDSQQILVTTAVGGEGVKELASAIEEAVAIEA